MDGEPIDSYHGVRRKVDSLQPGESARFTVWNVDSGEREEIYTAPWLSDKTDE